MAMVQEAQNEANHRHHSSQNDNIHRALKHYIFQYELSLHCHPFSFYDALAPILANQPNREHLQHQVFNDQKTYRSKKQPNSPIGLLIFDLDLNFFACYKDTCFDKI